MFVVTSRSEAPSPPLRRANGTTEISVVSIDGETCLGRLYQSDPCRVLFPRPTAGGAFEAVLVTTSGGIVGGDKITIQARAEAGAAATLVTQAAEKVYRSTGEESVISAELRAEMGALLEWMPQETILFDGARLRRRIQIDFVSGSRIMAGESAVFGRRARGERFTRGALHDDWRVVRDGRLVWADALHLAGDPAEAIDHPLAFGGAAAYATLIYAADDAADRLDEARALLADTAEEGCRSGATVLGPVLILRFLGSDAALLRRAYSRLWSTFRAKILNLPTRLPRVWET